MGKTRPERVGWPAGRPAGEDVRGAGARRPYSRSVEEGRRAQEGAASAARGNVTAIATMKPSLAS